MNKHRSFLLPILLLSFLLVLTSCAPSTSAIQTAIAQTLTAAPTATPTATSTSTPSPAPADAAVPPFPPNTELPPGTLILITPAYFETATEPPEDPELPTTPIYSEPANATLAEPQQPYPTHALTAKDFQPVGQTFENGFLLVAVMIILAIFVSLDEKDKH